MRQISDKFPFVSACCCSIQQQTTKLSTDTAGRGKGAQKKTNQRTKQKPRTKRAPSEWKIECDTRQRMAVGFKELKLSDAAILRIRHVLAQAEEQ